MRLKGWKGLAVLLLLSVALIGCGGIRGAEATPAATVAAPGQVATAPAAPAAPTVAPEAPAATGGQAAPAADDIDIADFDSLDSYRQLVSWIVTEGEETEEWSVTTEFVRDPAAQRTLYQGTFSSGTVTGWEIIQIGTITYMRYGEAGEDEQWMSVTSEDAQAPQQQLSMYRMQSADHYLSSGYCNRERGTADVEGRPAVHYTCSKDVFGTELLFWLAGGKLTDGGIEYWISTEYDVPLRTITWWEGEDEDGVAHAWRMEEKVWDINVPFVIEPPAGAKALGLPEDVPLMPEAKITSAMSGMVSFEITAEMGDVVEYYKEAMPDNGWTLDSEYEGMLTFTKHGRQAVFMLNEDAGKISGVIMITE